MRTATTPQKMLFGGCAAAMTAAGLSMTVPVPAHADEQPVCTEYKFNSMGPFRFRTIYEDGAVLAQATGKPLSGKSAQTEVVAQPFDSSLLGEIRGPLKARIDGRHLHMTWDTGQIYLGNQTHYVYDGDIGGDGHVSGGLGSDGATNFIWATDTQLSCALYQMHPDEGKPNVPPPPPADKPGPEISFDEKDSLSGILTVNVHNTIAEDTHCTYTAKPQPPSLVQERPPIEFDLFAKATYPVVITGAFRTIPPTTYTVTVACDGRLPTTQEKPY